LWAKVRRLLLFRKKQGEDDDGVDAVDIDSTANDDKPRQMAYLDPSQDATDPTPFEFKPLQLAALLDPKSLDDLERMGGIEGVLHGLGADGVRGLREQHAAGTDSEGGRTNDNPRYQATFEDRKRVYGANTLPKKKSKTFLQLCWIAFQDKMLVSRPLPVDLPERKREREGDTEGARERESTHADSPDYGHSCAARIYI
jgi:Ca2+-transporting ATPase